MKNLIHFILLLAGIIMVVGCVEEEATGYYNNMSDSGYVSTYNGDVTAGYNRDYIEHKKKNTPVKESEV